MLDKQKVFELLRGALEQLDDTHEDAEYLDAFEVMDGIEAAQRSIQRAINQIEVA